MWSVAEAVRYSRADDRGSWLPRKSIGETALRKQGEEIGSARRHTGAEHTGNTQRIRDRESRFMQQWWPAAENEVGSGVP